jgi:hypothetical protein
VKALGNGESERIGDLTSYLESLLELAAASDPQVRHPSVAEIRARALSFAQDLNGRSERMGWVLRSRVGRDAVALAQNVADLMAIKDAAALDRIGSGGITDSWSTFLDDLVHPGALIDAEGDVFHVNRAWKHFAETNDGDLEAVGNGINYLAVCDAAARAGDHDGAVVGRALRELLTAGRTGVPVTWVYPCHSPTQYRWFQLTAFALPARQGAAVIHINVDADQPALAG